MQKSMRNLTLKLVQKPVYKSMQKSIELDPGLGLVLGLLGDRVRDSALNLTLIEA